MVMTTTREVDIKEAVIIHASSLPGSFMFRMNTGAVHDGDIYSRDKSIKIMVTKDGEGW